jgi:2-amino-4-hydroxy-6-hydroxymethyldihydropteridine diphosphokinase
VFPDRGPIAELLDASDSSGVKRREDLTLEVE